jgi:AraC-like DNA-binding protein
MQTLQTALPDARLAPFVRGFASRESRLGPSCVLQPLVGSLEHILSFDFCDLTNWHRLTGVIYPSPRISFLGAHTGLAGFACLRGHILSFGIFFRPFALWQLFGIPASEMVGLECDGAAIWGSWVTELWHRLACSRSFSERIAVATESLLKFVGSARPLTSIMSTARRLLPTGTSTKVAHVARKSAMSIRSYERQFACEVGFAPKEFARVARFARAIDMQRMNRDTWLNISHELGFYDQMHMIRDFRLLGGDAPGRLLRPDSDFQPWSIGNALRATAKTSIAAEKTLDEIDDATHPSTST